MKIAFFESSRVSSYLNGHAIYCRGLLKALARSSHGFAFFKPDGIGRQRRSGIPDSRLMRVPIYPATADGRQRALAEAIHCDLLAKANCVLVFDAEFDQAIRTGRKPHAGPCPPDRRRGRYSRSRRPHLRISRPRGRRPVGGDDAGRQGRRTILNIVPLRRPDMSRALSGHLHFFWHARAKEAPVRGTRPPLCESNDMSRCQTTSGTKMLTDGPNDVCYFLCKTPAERGEPRLGMLVSAAKSNIKVGIQTSSHWFRGKSPTLEELL